MKKIFASLLVGFLALPVSILSDIKPAQAAFSAGNIISDAEFINWTVLSAAGIQAFLNTKGGTRLRTFSEGGRSAAQIIADAARGNGLNPLVILATIQKEESLVDSNTNFDFRVNWAMGYGVCDSCSLDDPDVAKRRGFTNQIDNGAWQLKRNYSYHAANGSDWNVGKTMIIDGTAVRFANRATSSLYRYTPHLPGNQNFYNIYNRYKGFRGQGVSGGGGYDDYSAQYVDQYGGANSQISLRPNQRRTIRLRYRNNGVATWNKSGSQPVSVGNSSPENRNSIFTGGNIRWRLTSSRVRSGQIGTFRITVQAPSQPGQYIEKFRPLAEGIRWMGEEATFTFNVGGSSQQVTNGQPDTYSASFYGQYKGNQTIDLRPGQRLTIYVRYRNTGTAQWNRTGANAVHLGNSSPQDRASAFTGGNTRWQMTSSRAKSNRLATFRTTITAPQTPGVYTEKFRPVAEYITWFGPETTFTFNVK